MSKYVTKRLEKINQLKEKLNNVNSKIESYITILEKIKKKRNIFSIKYSIINDINEDPDIKCFNYNFYLLFDDYYLYNIDINYKFHKNISKKFKNVISIIEQHINLEDFANYIFTANCMYDKIKSLYFEILTYGQFSKTANTLISNLKKMIKNKTIENNEKHFYSYFSIQQDNKEEKIYFVYQTYKTYQYGNNYLYKVKLPLIEDIDKIYIERNTNSKYNVNLYITIFKELLLSLNKEFFNFLNVNEHSINFEFDLDSKISNFNIDYTKINTYSIYIEPLNQNKINIILDKLKFQKELSNF